MGLLLLEGPDNEPVDVAELLEHSRELDAAQAASLESYGVAAREHLENGTGRAFLTQQWQATFDRFPAERFLKIPRPPLQTIDAVEYLDSSGVLTTWDPSNYTVDKSELFGRVVLGYGKCWPITLCSMPSAVRVTFTAGYGDEGEDMPANLRQAIKLLAGHWYEHREPVLTGTIQSPLPYAVEAILTQYQTGSF